MHDLQHDLKVSRRTPPSMTARSCDAWQDERIDLGGIVQRCCWCRRLPQPCCLRVDDGHVPREWSGQAALAVDPPALLHTELSQSLKHTWRKSRAAQCKSSDSPECTNPRPVAICRVLSVCFLASEREYLARICAVSCQRRARQLVECGQTFTVGKAWSCCARFSVWW